MKRQTSIIVLACAVIVSLIFDRFHGRKQKVEGEKKFLAIMFLLVFLFAGYVFTQETKLPELIPYRKGDKWGFCDMDRKIVIPIKYYEVGFFSEEGLPWLDIMARWEL